jgi:beta-lactamase class A
MFRLAFLAWLVLVGVMIPVGASAGARYDVSYVWAANLNNVQDYKQKVGRVLGPAMSRQLKVVRQSGLYGLIYHRRGDGEGAAGVARAHTRLLRSHGLEAAAPIRSQDWSFVATSDTAPSNVQVSYSPPPTQSSRLPDVGDLSVAVDGLIKDLRRQGLLAADERTAWSVYDFTTGKKLVGINEDIQLQAASLIKPFLALAFFHKVKNKELFYGPKSRRHMERMIRYSSNSSTNWVMRYLGGPQGAQAILSQNYPDVVRDTNIVEYIPANGRTYRNKASAHDYSRFLYALWNEFIPGAGEIKRLMALPSANRLYTGADAIPKGTLVYNKTGSTAMLCGDIGILVVKGRNGQYYPYTVVGIIEKRGRATNYTSWIRSRGDVIRRVSSLVYTGISQQHNLASAL